MGLYLSDEKENDVIKSFQSSSSTVDFSSPQTTNTPNSVSAALSLTFLRDVGTDQLVGAIVSALENKEANDGYKNALEMFRSTLVNALTPTKGASTGDEIDFVFSGTESLFIAVKGKSAGSVHNSAFRRKLMELYTAKQTQLTPDLVACLEKRYL